MRSVIDISLKKIQKNWEILNQLSNKNASAVVKANAYGLGMIEISRALLEKGCKFFYVAQLEEAIHLRKFFPSKKIKISVFEGLIHDPKYYYKYNLIPILNNFPQFQLLEKYNTTNIRSKIKAILNFDTGMNRLGFDEKDKQLLIKNFTKFKNTEIIYLMSHLSKASLNSSKENKKQLNKLSMIQELFNYPKLTLSNTNGILLGSRYVLDQTRPGIGIYGVDANGKQVYVKNRILCFPFVLKCPIIQIREVKKGSKISYNGLTKVVRDSKLATIGIGYADGILKLLRNRINISIKGVDCNIMGAITMDSFIIDITDLKNTPKIGDYIDLLSGDNIYKNFLHGSNLSIYEIFTLISDRIKKNYI